MEIGVCASWEKAKEVKEAGFDYIECPLNKLALLSDEEFEEVKKGLKESNLKMKSTSILFPKDMVLLGEKAKRKEIESYLDKAFSRMKEMGSTVAVFGSGKSRFIPEGYSYDEAFSLLIDLTKVIVEKANENGVVVVIEALNKNETNLINNLTEAKKLSSETGASLLADSFHMAKESEAWSTISLVSPLSHAHIATFPERRYPIELDENLKCFIKELKKNNYKGNISIEAKTESIVNDGKRAIREIRKAWEE